VVYPGTAGRFEVLVRFDRPMDTSSFLLPGAVSAIPPVDLMAVSAVGTQTLDFVMDAVADGGPYPLKLGTAYAFTLGATIHAANGVALSPTVLTYTTGPFGLAELFSGNATAVNNGLFYPSTNIPQALCLAFNGPLDNTVPAGGQLGVAPGPGLITGMSYGAAGGNGAINTVQYTVCGAQPSTSYAFAYAGGFKSVGGAVAGPVSGIARVSEPLRVVSWHYDNGSSGYYDLGLSFNYQVNLTSTAAVISFSPPLAQPWTPVWTNDGCGNASLAVTDPVTPYNPFIPSGLTETVTISTGLQDLVGNAPLGAPYSATFYQP
jgi:hypothetical protein